MTSVEGRRADKAGVAIALVLLAIAGVIFWDMSRLQLTSVYGLGPKAAPIVVASGLAMLALGNLVLAIRGDIPSREASDPKAILLILGGLAVLIAAIGLGGGFIVGTAVLFAATAAAFGRRALLADLAIGMAVAVVVYSIFVKLLGLSLPIGPLERLF